MKVLITGGCGFIGSNFIRFLLRDINKSEVEKVINLDKQTYAGQGQNIEHMKLDKDGRYKFFKVDICNKDLVDRIFEGQKPDWIFNFAAESHVDRSIESSEDFIKSNVLGATNLFDAAKKYEIKRIVQISTDEVYGSIKEGSFSEDETLNPTSPYSACKASAELIAQAYFKTHSLPVVITRSANNYGPYQFPEKFLPLFITNLIDGKKVPLMWSPENPGLNVRDNLNVNDNCRAIWFVAKNAKDGEVYNIPGGNERTNAELTNMLLKHFGYGEDMIMHIEHRKAHDFRYAINGQKLKNMGFEYKHSDFDRELVKLVDWYQKNPDWWRPLK